MPLVPLRQGNVISVKLIEQHGRVGVILGGIPCQPYARHGNRGGVFQADAGACLVSVVIWTLMLGARAFVGEEVSDFDAQLEASMPPRNYHFSSALLAFGCHGRSTALRS